MGLSAEYFIFNKYLSNKLYKFLMIKRHASSSTVSQLSNNG